MTTQQELTPELIRAALTTVKFPGFSRDIVSFGLVKKIDIDAENNVTIDLVIESKNADIPRYIFEGVHGVMKHLPGVKHCDVNIEHKAPEARKGINDDPSTWKSSVPGAKHVIAVASGKGGVGKSSVTVNLAAALAAQAEALLNKSEGFALLDGSVEEPMKAAIRAAGAEGDSVGGVLETAILGLPAGVGEPYFDSVESKLAHLAFSIPAVKGIEFGSGFGFADQKGSEANDAFRMQGERIVTATNHNAGLNGGISNGMPVVFRTAVKPTPSIYKTQDTVDYIAKKDAELSIQGRHDPCIVPRAAIVQTCAAALAVGDLLTAKYGMAWMEDPTGYRKEVL